MVASLSKPHPSLQPLIEAGKISMLGSNEKVLAITIEENVVEKFYNHLLTYPLVEGIQDSIDWKKVSNSKSVDIALLSDNEVESFIRSCTISSYKKVAYVHGHKGCYILSLETLIENFDEIVRGVGHQVYFVGITEDHLLTFHFDDFLEYEADEGLILSGRLI